MVERRILKNENFLELQKTSLFSIASQDLKGKF